MPIKGFNSIEEQTRDGVEEKYGPNLTLKSKIPYICDKSGYEFNISWKLIKYRMKDKFFIRYQKTDECKKIVLGLLEEGRSRKEIMNIIGYKKSTLDQLITRNFPKFHSLRFSNDEIKFLSNNYPTMGEYYCAKKLNRKLSSIKCKVVRMKLRKIKEKLPDNHKRCNCCLAIKPFDEFHKDKKSKDGFNTICAECNNKKTREYSQNIKKDEKNNRLFYLRNILSNAKYRAKNKNIDFDLDLKWLDENTKECCPALGIKFTFRSDDENKKWYSSPTIDKINPSMGYTKNNCMVISFRANTIKNNASIEELIQIGEFYKQFKKD